MARLEARLGLGADDLRNPFRDVFFFDGACLVVALVTSQRSKADLLLDPRQCCP